MASFCLGGYLHVLNESSNQYIDVIKEYKQVKILKILAGISATPQPPQRYTYGIDSKIQHCLVLDLSHSESLTSDVEVKVAGIRPRPRFLVDDFETPTSSRS